MWQSGQLKEPPVVRYGLTKNLDQSEYAHTTSTYTADSMCQTPATGHGFWHPGYTYNVLLKNLKPNTRYVSPIICPQNLETWPWQCLQDADIGPFYGGIAGSFISLGGIAGYDLPAI